MWVRVRLRARSIYGAFVKSVERLDPLYDRRQYLKRLQLHIHILDVQLRLCDHLKERSGTVGILGNTQIRDIELLAVPEDKLLKRVDNISDWLDIQYAEEDRNEST